MSNLSAVIARSHVWIIKPLYEDDDDNDADS